MKAEQEMLEMSPRFLSLANRHIEGTAPQAVIGFNLFQTPGPIALKMSKLIIETIKPDSRILEPSAGLGRLYEPLKDSVKHWQMVENRLECCVALKKAINKAGILNADFLETSIEQLGGSFDAVIMNPPFKQGTDIKHIKHALAMVRTGGRLVSLCYNGVKQNKTLKPIADYWEVLPEKSFKKEGTSASVALLVIDKD